MSTNKRILFPIDLSDNSLAALDLATRIAKEEQATIVFLHVEPPMLPEIALYAAEAWMRQLEENAAKFKDIRPQDESVRFEHATVQGNPGPQIVEATANVDLCVMSSHGRSGVLRFLMGSIAEYVLRHAKCPVVLVKNFEVFQSTTSEGNGSEHREGYVTEIMHQVAAVHKDDSIQEVLRLLKQAKETAAPVVDCDNRCIGILTSTDIDNFYELKRRYDEGDPTVIEKMFKVDEFGQFRCNNDDFGNVARHMTADVISLSNESSVDDARQLFANNHSIHHLVVLDQDDRPVGIIDACDVSSASPKVSQDAKVDV